MRERNDAVFLHYIHTIFRVLPYHTNPVKVFPLGTYHIGRLGVLLAWWGGLCDGAGGAGQCGGGGGDQGDEEGQLCGGASLWLPPHPSTHTHTHTQTHDTLSHTHSHTPPWTKTLPALFIAYIFYCPLLFIKTERLFVHRE